MDMTYGPRPCPRCGAENPPLAARCAACGTEFGAGASPRPAGTPSSARIAIFGGAVVLALVAIVGLASAPYLEALGGAPATAGPVAYVPPPATAQPPTDPPTASAPAAPAPSVAGSSGVVASPAAPSATPPATGGNRGDPNPGAGTSITMRLPRLSRSIPGSTGVHYYSISGHAPIDLIHQMERKGQRSCEQDALACVYLRPNVTWSTATNPTTKACVVTGVQSSLDATVYLPRWTKPARVYRAVVGWWREVLDHIAWHEGRHIAIEQRWIAKLEDRLPGQACDRARRIARNWVEDVADAQHAFDAHDRKTWTYPAYDGPGGFFGN